MPAQATRMFFSSWKRKAQHAVPHAIRLSARAGRLGSIHTYYKMDLYLFALVPWFALLPYLFFVLLDV